MSEASTDCLDPWKAADREQVFEQQIAIDQLPRLTEVLMEPGGVVSAQLYFKRDEDRLAILTGQLGCSLRLQCQRCMQVMDFPLQAEISIGFARTAEQAEQMPDRYDAFEVENEQVCIREIIEDELLLSLPLVPMHAESDCVIKTEFGEGIIVEAEPEKENPFAVLASLKSDKPDD